MTDHYSILGVTPASPASAIRAAYLGKMKRHHPDAGQGDPAEAAAAAARLNAAYFVLRDPARRRAYDDSLFAARRGLPSRGHAVPAGRAPAPAPRKGRRVLAMAILFSLLAYGVSYGDWRASLPKFIGNYALAKGKWTDDGSAAPPPVPRGIPVDEADIAASIDDLEWIMVNGDLEDGVTHSRRCWEDYSWNPSIGFFDRCAAFDLAARLSAAPGGAAARKYLASAATTARHENALRLLSSAAFANRQHLVELERQVQSALAASRLTALLAEPQPYQRR